MDLPSLDQHPFVSGGLILMVAGWGLYYLRRLHGTCLDFIERHFILRVEILDDDEAYDWMQVWLAKKLHRTLAVSVVTRRSPAADADDEDLPADRRVSRPAIYFVPAVGTHFFWYQKSFVILHRVREENGAGGALLGGGAASSLRKESMTLRIFGRSQDLARRLLEECRDRALPDDGRLEIRIPCHHAWQVGPRIRPRPLGSVILAGDQAQELLADMRAFLASKAWYQRIGVPYRRGYLLYGPPGNGKTSVIKALVGELGMSIYLLVLSDPEMNDRRLNDLLSHVPDHNLILLEDIDCAFVRRTGANGKLGGLTFSGLLNAIDGVASPEARLLVMTTNHLERLDPALIRPGRADVKLAFGNATADQARRLFERFFPEDAALAESFAAQIEDERYSMATLQDYLMLHRHDPAAAVRRADEIGALQTNTREPPVVPGRDKALSCRPTRR